jgi:hypothetical protein
VRAGRQGQIDAARDKFENRTGERREEWQARREAFADRHLQVTATHAEEEWSRHGWSIDPEYEDTQKVSSIVEKGTVVADLPPLAEPLDGEGDLYFSDGLYLSPASEGAGYQVIDPPIGTRQPTLPEGAAPLSFKSVIYYYAQGVFYRREKDPVAFVVVAPPIGAKVPSIREDHETVTVKGTTYHVIGNIHFRGVYERGTVKWMVARVVE